MRKHQIYILLFAIIFIGCKHETGWVFDHEIILGDVMPIGLVVENDTLWVSGVKNNNTFFPDYLMLDPILKSKTKQGRLKIFDLHERGRSAIFQ